MMVSGFMFKLGQFDFFPMYLLLVSGDLISDIGWYTLGRYGTRSLLLKYGHYFGITSTLITKAEDSFNKYRLKILIISKLSMGMGLAFIVQIVAGMFKVPFKHYVLINTAGGFVWTAFLVTIGYFLGNIFLLIPESMKIIFSVIILIILIIAIRYIRNYLRKNE